MNQMLTLVTSQMSALAIEQVAISTLATGGVCWPMARLSVTMMPKCTGSMPTAMTSGMTIGTTRMIAAAECRNIPMMQEEDVEDRQHGIFVLGEIEDGRGEPLRHLRLGEIDAEQRRCGDQQHDDGGLHGAVDRRAREMRAIQIAVDHRRR